MKILYGVQATGQGHISRARAMSRAFEQYDVDVTWLFSGRSRNKLFDMAPFGNYECRRGLSFTSREGRIRYLQTARDNNAFRFLSDVRALDLSPYQLIVTDYEPVTAWAARLGGRRSIGIGHQYAFGAQTPVAGDDWLSRAIMSNSAPVDTALGLHWYPYADYVLPAVLDLPTLPEAQAQHILVYLPFEDQERVSDLLCRMPEHLFVQYANGLDNEQRENVARRPASTEDFKHDLASCAGVICNSGFELISECLQWRKPVLTRPLAGQMEQLSNAFALQQLGLATIAHELTEDALRRWLLTPGSPPDVHFVDVATALAAWLAGGCQQPPHHLGRQLWYKCRIPGPARTSRTLSRSSITNQCAEALSS